jgi:ligand-binding sensor domain-containing protein
MNNFRFHLNKKWSCILKCTKTVTQKTLPILAFAVVFPFIATAQNWINYTYSNGLVSNGVTSIAIDAQSNKWFGTTYGVSEFDGTNWTTYLPHTYVNTIIVDAQNNEWFGTATGLAKFDGVNWTFYGPGSPGYFVGNCVWAVALDAQGNVWIGTNLGIGKFDGTSWTTYLYRQNVTSLVIDTQGKIWVGFGISGDGVQVFDGTKWGGYTIDNGLAYNYVYSIAVDAQNNKWFGTFSGVSKFDGVSLTTYLANTRINAIAVDAQNNKWFGTNKGVTKFDGTNWTSYTKTDGLPSDSIYAIAIDTRGNKWFGFGLYGYGAEEFNENGVTSVKEAVNENSPKDFSLFQNYPNPFNPSTTISFSLPRSGFATLKIYDLMGREVTTIISEELQTGTYSRQWNATNMSSGIYFYRLQAGSFIATKKLLLLK